MWHKKETNPQANVMVILKVDIELTAATPHPPPKVYSIPHKIGLLNPVNHSRRLRWTKDSLETLRGLSVTHRLTFTDYINFCVDNVASKKNFFYAFPMISRI